jgi:hypothetical protein
MSSGGRIWSLTTCCSRISALMPVLAVTNAVATEHRGAALYMAYSDSAAGHSCKQQHHHPAGAHTP